MCRCNLFKQVDLSRQVVCVFLKNKTKKNVNRLTSRQRLMCVFFFSHFAFLVNTLLVLGFCVLCVGLETRGHGTDWKNKKDWKEDCAPHIQEGRKC